MSAHSFRTYLWGGDLLAPTTALLTRVLRGEN